MRLNYISWLFLPALAVLGYLVSHCTHAKADHPGEALANIVPAATVKRILDAGDSLILIDLRPTVEFQKQRLPRARSIPSTEMESRVREVPRLGRVVLYCACQMHEIVDKAVMLQTLGYRNIAVMPEGYAGWLALGFPIEESTP